MIRKIIKEDTSSRLKVGDTVQVLPKNTACDKLQEVFSNKEAADMLNNNYVVRVIESENVRHDFQVVSTDCIDL